MAMRAGEWRRIIAHARAPQAIATRYADRATACRARRANASFASTADKTMAPPASVAGPGFSFIRTHTQTGPRIGSSNASNPSSVAGQIPRRGGRQQAAGAELDRTHRARRIAISRADGRERRRQRKRDHERNETGDHHLRQHVDGRVELAQQRDLRRKAARDAEREQISRRAARRRASRRT